MIFDFRKDERLRLQKQYPTRKQQLSHEKKYCLKAEKSLAYTYLKNALELCENLTEAYLRHTDEEKRVLPDLLCRNFFYDGEKLNIIMK